MKKLIVILFVEVLLCAFFTSRINCNEYRSWVQANAVVKEIDYYEKSRVSARNQDKDYYVVFIDYADVSKHIRFADYKPDFKESDEIIVKYNSDDPENVVYIPYEEHCVAAKKRNTILLFSGAIGITLVMFWANRKEN